MFGNISHLLYVYDFCTCFLIVLILLPRFAGINLFSHFNVNLLWAFCTFLIWNTLFLLCAVSSIDLTCWSLSTFTFLQQFCHQMIYSILICLFIKFIPSLECKLNVELCFSFLFICIFIHLHHWSYCWYTEQGLVHDTNSKVCWRNTLFLNSIKILFESITFVF